MRRRNVTKESQQEVPQELPPLLNKKVVFLPWEPSWQQVIAATALVLSLYLAGWQVASLALYRTPTPAPDAAPKHVFSEARALKHVKALAEDIGERQVGTPGFDSAVSYIEKEIRTLAARPGPHLKVEIDREDVSGAFPLFILMSNLTLAYQNLPNLLLRVAAADADPDAPAILISSHYDTAIGSPGAADCASGNAVALEIARLLIQSEAPPKAPVLFLWTGGEEIFSMAAHGFITTSKWRQTVGAVLNLEASGSDGPDLMFQASGGWPARVYAAVAKHPRASGTGTDLFASGLIMGDTDFRIYARDYGSVPGLDIAYILGGYNYHTYFDNVQRLRSGIMQAMGENVIALVKGMSEAPELQNYTASNDEWATHFDFMGMFCIYYERTAAFMLHSLPLCIVVLAVLTASRRASGLPTLSSRLSSLSTAFLAQAAGFLLAIILPALAAAWRVKLSGKPMAWWSHNQFAAAQAIPLALFGLLLPQMFRDDYRGDPAVQRSLDWSGHWGGTVGFPAVLASVLTVLRLRSSFVPFFWSLLMSPALTVSQLLGPLNSIPSLAAYLAIYSLPMCYSLYAALIFCHFVLEKLGMSGCWPLPWGPYIADVIIAALYGFETAIIAGPVIPAFRRWCARARTARVLLYLGFAAAVLSGNLFPYSDTTPKRFILQKTIWTHGDSAIDSTKWSFGTVDPLPPSFVFDNVPKLRERFLRDGATLQPGRHGTWLSAFPIGELINRFVEVDAEPSILAPAGSTVPHIRVLKSEGVKEGRRRVYLEVDNGVAGRAAHGMLNVTGPLLRWSLTDKLPPASIVPGRPPSYMLKIAGAEKTPFWLEADNEEELTIGLSVMAFGLTEEMKSIMDDLPGWVAVTITTSYSSSWTI